MVFQLTLFIDFKDDHATYNLILITKRFNITLHYMNVIMLLSYKSSNNTFWHYANVNTNLYAITYTSICISLSFVRYISKGIFNLEVVCRC
jgi:amino acid transporter